MKKLVCKNCPNRCRLQVRETDGELDVEGNLCMKGVIYANEQWNRGSDRPFKKKKSK